jgi:hypothetical protein
MYAFSLRLKFCADLPENRLKLPDRVTVKYGGYTTLKITPSVKGINMLQRDEEIVLSASDTDYDFTYGNEIVARVSYKTDSGDVTIMDGAYVDGTQPFVVSVKVNSG